MSMRQLWNWCWEAMLGVHAVGKGKGFEYVAGVAVAVGSGAGQGWLPGCLAHASSCCSQQDWCRIEVR
jgi:hypothetical protein